MNRADRRKIQIIGVAALAAVLVAGLVLYVRGRRVPDEVKDGIAYVQKLENQDMTAIEASIREQKEARRKAESEKLRKELLEGSVDVWSLFDDTVILGDSRTVGFYSYNFLPESKVIADGGNTIRNLEEKIPDLVKKNPASLFLCYGLNDVSIGYWTSPEDYVKEYGEALDKIRDKLPDTDIYVNSIYPAQPVAIQLEDSWKRIPEYSEAVGKMCREKGIGWVDCDEIAEEYVSLYDVDGIHFKKDFYPVWATQMLITTYEDAETDASEGGNRTDFSGAADGGEKLLSTSEESGQDSLSD